ERREHPPQPGILHPQAPGRAVARYLAVIVIVGREPRESGRGRDTIEVLGPLTRIDEMRRAARAIAPDVAEEDERRIVGLVVPVVSAGHIARCPHSLQIGLPAPA